MAPRRNSSEVWTEQRVIEALGEIGRTTRPGFAAAIQNLTDRLGSTYGALRHAFRRRGLRSPTYYCAPSEEMGEVEVPLETPPPEAPTEPAPPVVNELTSEAERLGLYPPADRTYVDRPEVVYRYEPLDLGSELERIAIFPDTHAPFHDKRAWAAAMGFVREWRPHTFIHLCDWVDCFAVSDHDKDPRRGTQLEAELAVMKEQREEIDALPGLQRKLASLGNHEFRLERYMMRQAPALLGLMDIAQLMELPQHGWHVVPYMSHGKIGKLRFTHGTRHSGAYSVHQNAAAFSSSVVFGHTHRLGCTYFGDVDGNRHISANLGWLGNLREASYVDDVSKRWWQHGFGTVLMRRDGRFELQLKPIVDGEVIR